MEKVAFDLPQYYPPVPLPPYAAGEVIHPWIAFDLLSSLNRFVAWLSRCVSIQSMAANMQPLVSIFVFETNKAAVVNR